MGIRKMKSNTPSNDDAVKGLIGCIAYFGGIIFIAVLVLASNGCGCSARSMMGGY